MERRRTLACRRQAHNRKGSLALTAQYLELISGIPPHAECNYKAHHQAQNRKDGIGCHGLRIAGDEKRQIGNACHHTGTRECLSSYM